MKDFFIKKLSQINRRSVDKWAKNPLDTQNNIFQQLIRVGRKTKFGTDHNFSQIITYSDFQKHVPVRDYEQFKPYIDQALLGKKNILWQGTPLYFCESSGTTSGVKYIPISSDSIKYQIKSAKDVLLNYVSQTGNTKPFKGKMMFLQGNPKLTKKNGYSMGRLSGIVAHHVPFYLQKNRLPSWQANMIENWEHKLDKIIQETLKQDLRLIGGIPPWIQGYFEKLIQQENKPITQIFPNLSLYVYGGVNFDPYRKSFEHLLGNSVDYLETFPASEGFFAYQDRIGEPGLRLELNSGIFYEFIPLNDYNENKINRLTLEHVELGVDYVLTVSTNAGLWAYDVGDVVKFISKDPYRIVFSGRSKHFISAYGEHVIGKEVEEAMTQAIAQKGGQVAEFTVAPLVEKQDGKDKFAYQWYIEFTEQPKDLKAFASLLQSVLQEQNKYYNDLVNMKLVGDPEIHLVKSGGFVEYMKSIGKYGGQNKTPRLKNDRTIVSQLELVKS